MRTTFFTLLLVLLTAPLSAQTVIPGRVLDPQEQPVANVEVLLHALTDSTGEEVSKDTSAADGSFQLGAQSLDADAVYFVTVVWNGQLYMGDMLRPPFPRDQEYIVRIGVNPVDFSGGSAANVQEVAPEVAQRDRTAGLMVIIVSVLAIGVVAFFALRRRPPAHRRWLVELARIEDDLGANPNDDALLKRREELRSRLLK